MKNDVKRLALLVMGMVACMGVALVLVYNTRRSLPSATAAPGSDWKAVQVGWTQQQVLDTYGKPPGNTYLPGCILWNYSIPPHGSLLLTLRNGHVEALCEFDSMTNEIIRREGN